MKIDVFNHVFPVPFFERLEEFLPKAPLERWKKSIPTIYDMDARLRMMDEFDDYAQIISLSQPPLDEFAGPDQSPALARLANDGMADICKAHPDRFVGFISTLAMNNPDEAVKEVERSIVELGAVGIQLHTNVNEKALDRPEFYPVFERCVQLGKPIWLHPSRPQSHPDYLAEDGSMYDIFWGLGWAYETSASMSRIVWSGMMDKLPEMKIICHHWGAYIPHAEGRLMTHWGKRKGHIPDDGMAVLQESLKRPPIDYFKDFLVDTAMFGSVSQSQCGLDFFGADNSFFATDCPYDSEGGAQLIRDTIKVIDGLRCSDEDRAKIYLSNTQGLIGLG